MLFWELKGSPAEKDMEIFDVIADFDHGLREGRMLIRIDEDRLLLR